MANYQFTNLAQTALTGSSGTTSPVTGTVETWTVVSSAAFPAASSGTNQFVVNDTAFGFKTEIILVTNVSGTTWTVTRGAEGTTPIAHVAGATVQIVTSAAFLNGILSPATGTKNQVLSVASGGAAAYVTECVNVLNYGAVADSGVTDNLAAFNSAASDAAAGGLELYIPGNVNGYGVSADWLVPAGVRVRGAGAYNFKNPGVGGAVPGNNSGVFYGSVIMPTNGATFTNAVVVLNGFAAALKEVCVVGNIAGWAAGNAPSAHNAPRAIQVAGRGCRLYSVQAWGGLACGIDLGDGTSGNVAQDTNVTECTANNSLNPPLIITVSGCSWTNSSTTITTSGNFTTSGIFPGMTLSPTFNGIPQGCVVTAVGTTTLTISSTTSTLNAGPVTLEFIGGIGLRIASSSDCMVSGFRTSSACCVVGGGNTDFVNNHWSAGSTTTNWYEVYVQHPSGNKFTGDVFDCATNIAGQVRRDRGNVILAGCRFQNLNATGTAIPMLTDNEPSGVGSQGAFQLLSAQVTTSNTGSADGFSYMIQFSGSGNPALAVVDGVAIDSGAMQHSPVLYNGGTPGISRTVQVGTNLIETLPKWTLTQPAAPTGALMETMPRWAATTTKTAPVSGTLYVMAIPLPAGLVVANITLNTGSTAEAGGTHGWYALLDSGLVVRAVSADQTGAAVWAANSFITLAMAASYTIPSSGLYYIGFCVVATTMPTFAGGGAPQGGMNASPVFAGSSSTGQTTPPTTGTTMGALTQAGGIANIYAYTS